jgi:pimeloyl-ACP methyl ester carboxylesterase
MDRRATFGDPLSQLSLTREFEDVAAAVGSLGSDVALFGHSSGALCALGASLLTPGISHLILYEPPLEQGPQYAIALRELQALLTAGDVDRVLDVWLTDYVGMPVPVAEKVKRSPIGADIRPFAQFLPREMAAHLDWHVDPAAFARVTAPTIYLVGSDTPEDNAQLRGFISLLQDTMPIFSVREIPGQGHFANYFAAELLAKTILESMAIERRKTD